MAISRATLVGYSGGHGSTILPVQFSYNPPVPVIRSTVHKVASGDIVVHGANNVGSGLPGDALIEWRLDAANREEWYGFQYLYWTDPLETVRRFVGYWGDSFDVLMWRMDSPTVRGTLFDLSGRFLVTGVVSVGLAS